MLFDEGPPTDTAPGHIAERPPEAIEQWRTTYE
jgi:hypothetical protein